MEIRVVPTKNRNEKMSQPYRIIIEETVVGEFELSASSPVEAFEKAKEKYKAGIMVNEPGECQKMQIYVLDAKGDRQPEPKHKGG